MEKVDTGPTSYRYKKSLDWKDDTFWNDLPNPKFNPLRNNNNKRVNEVELVAKECVDFIFTDVLTRNKPQKTEIIASNPNNFLCEKYFKIWKYTIQQKKETREHEELVTRQKEKLDNFITQLKKCKKNEKIKHKKDVESVDKSNGNSEVANRISQPNNFKNRFTAQKTVIAMQKAKLEEQNQIINELKLGILNEDLEKSMEKSKLNLREIFADCSKQVKYKIPLILSETPPFSISTQRAPKVIQKMEQRALERAQNREIILERKRLIEEKRQKIVEEALENKKVLEEDEKKRSLEMIKERRRKELEIERIRQINKQIFMEKLDKAVQFHNKHLKIQSLAKLYSNMQSNRKNNCLAFQHFRTKLLKTALNNLLVLVEARYKIKYDVADSHFKIKLLRRGFSIWCNIRLESIRNMQVAEDIYDFRLTSNIFINWHRYVCKQFMIQRKALKIAEVHHNRWLLFHYFYQWRSLKAVLQLEKAKEIKKAKWRQKVWEILPDYKPPDLYYS